jgi:hypothetical protein
MKPEKGLRFLAVCKVILFSLSLSFSHASRHASFSQRSRWRLFLSVGGRRQRGQATVRDGAGFVGGRGGGRLQEKQVQRPASVVRIQGSNQTQPAQNGSLHYPPIVS